MTAIGIKANPIILNLTQHVATPDQEAQGVINLPDELRQLVINNLTFDDIPSADEINERASNIVKAVVKYHVEQCDGVCLDPEHETLSVMLGGAPFLMPALESHFKALMAPTKVLYAFSKRQSIETMSGNEVQKTIVFKHVGFVEAN